MALTKSKIDEQIKRGQELRKDLLDNISKNESHVDELDVKMRNAYELIEQMDLLKHEYQAIIDSDKKLVKTINDHLETLGLIRLTQSYFG